MCLDERARSNCKERYEKSMKKNIYIYIGVEVCVP